MSDSDAEVPVHQPQGGAMSLQHPVEIDEVLLKIASNGQQIEHLKALKRHRTAVIDAEISRLEADIEQSRSAIQQVMKSSGDKTLKFPGVGAVTRKPGTSRWNVLDEDALVSYLKKSAGLSPQTLGEVLVTKETIAKGKLNKVLDDLSKHGALKTSAVVRETSPEQVSISFDKSDAFSIAVKDAAALPEPEAPTVASPPTAPRTDVYDDLDL